MSRTLLFVDAKSRVEYERDSVFIDGKEERTGDEEKARELAQHKAWDKMSEAVSQYTTTFKNVAVLTAAGTSIDNGANPGKTRDALWDYCMDEIAEIQVELAKRSAVMKANIEKASLDKDIEEFLSLVVLDEKLNGEYKNAAKKSPRQELQKKIAEACRLTLDPGNSHHGDFMKKLTARKSSDPRVQLFTTNYDTLFEQAATRLGFTIIDGFSFTHPRVFNGTNFDYDIVNRERSRIKPDESFIPNVIQMYKIHGSIDWQRGRNGEIIQVENTDTPCVIYPASNKYESSYEQPYIEMIAHFQQTLRKEGTLLIVTGFGFKDKHLQNVIKEAVFRNPNFHLLIVCYDGKGISAELAPGFLSADLKTMTNVTIVHSKFKDFVEHYPLNMSYNSDDNSFFPHATV